jgi:hypothetical protein
MDAEENSGSITVTSGPPGQPQLNVVWERKRDGPLRLRAGSVGEPSFPIPEAWAFLDQVTNACGSALKERVRVRGQLVYDGPPWRGELWLTDSLRLGPPSKQDETALWGSRVIVVDAVVDAIDRLDAASVSQVLMRDLSVFLTLVQRTSVTVDVSGRRGWTWTAGATGQIESEVRQIGYRETDFSPEMPIRGSRTAVPVAPVQRPDFSHGGLTQDVREQQVPADILDLWRAFVELPPDRRDQFRKAGSLWQLALSLPHDYETTKFSLMVVACEALKPQAREYRRHNIYDVIGALLGAEVATVLRQDWFRPQEARSAHLHAGEFLGSEFIEWAMMSSFQDPTFDQATRTLWRVGSAALTEWLRRGGAVVMPPLNRRRTWRRMLKERALTVGLIATVVGMVIGFVLARLVRP